MTIKPEACCDLDIQYAVIIQKSNIQMLALDYYMTLTWAIALWQCATFVVLERGLIQ